MREYKHEELYPHTKLLSSSQFIDYIRDPAAFYARWIVGFPMKESPALIFGKGFSELYADRSFDFRSYMKAGGVAQRLIDMAASVIKLFPRPVAAEIELVAEFEGWQFRATLDDLYLASDTIVENKTSALEWTQETIDNHLQIDFQCWTFWKKYGRPSKKTIVNWVDTSGAATKRLVTMKTKRTIDQLKKFDELVKLVISNLEAENFSEKFI